MCERERDSVCACVRERDSVSEREGERERRQHCRSEQLQPFFLSQCYKYTFNRKADEKLLSPGIFHTFNFVCPDSRLLLHSTVFQLSSNNLCNEYVCMLCEIYVYIVITQKSFRTMFEIVCKILVMYYMCNKYTYNSKTPSI